MHEKEDRWYWQNTVQRCTWKWLFVRQQKEETYVVYNKNNLFCIAELGVYRTNIFKCIPNIKPKFKTIFVV